MVFFFSSPLLSWTSGRTSLEAPLTVGMRNILLNNSDGERIGRCFSILLDEINAELKIMQFYKTAARIECNYGEARCISGSTIGKVTLPSPKSSPTTNSNISTRDVQVGSLKFNLLHCQLPCNSNLVCWSPEKGCEANYSG